MGVEFLAKLGVEYPLIQAPMAGGGDTPRLVAAVGNAGALGFFGASYLSPEQIVRYGKEVRGRTDRLFGVNLFAPIPDEPGEVDASDLVRARQRVEPFYRQVGLPVPDRVTLPNYSFLEQLEASLQTGASAFSFTFGLIPNEAVIRIKAAGLKLLGTATTVAEALALQNLGVDAVIAQGSEAGGHRGSFLKHYSESLIGTLALVPQVVDAVEIPVIASGGIMDGRGLASALCLGAVAVQLGTAFLTCEESGIPECYKTAILNASEDDLTITQAFSGKAARGISNLFTHEMADSLQDRSLLAFPFQNSLTRPLRTKAAADGNADFLSLWAGQGTRLARKCGAAELIQMMIAELLEASAQLQTALGGIPSL